MAAAKVSTNLTRLAVAKNPHHLLGVFYTKSLRALAKMPSDYAYRKHTEQILLERAEMVKKFKVSTKVFSYFKHFKAPNTIKEINNTLFL